MKKILLTLLTLVIAFSVASLKTARASEADAKGTVKGDLELMVYFKPGLDYDGLDGKNLSLKLKSARHESSLVQITKDKLSTIGNTEIVTVSLNGVNYNATVTAYNEYDVAITNEPDISSIGIRLNDLPQDTYSIDLSAIGYKDYSVKNIQIDKYSKKAIVFTNDGRFSAGDLNADNVIDEDDLAIMIDNLDKNITEVNKIADLNADGKIDITDLAILNRNIKVPEFSGTEVYDTDLIKTNIIDQVEADKIINDLGTSEDILLVEGSGAIGDLINGTEVPVVLQKRDNKVVSEESPISIPVPLSEGNEIETSQINIVTPSNLEITSGVVVIEDTNGNTTEVPFNSQSSLGLLALTKNGEHKNTVTISLGKKVAVKKVTIKVTAVEDENGNKDYVSVEKIEFIKDIVPENPKTDSGVVKNLNITSSTKEFLLSWDRVPNITGYKVYISDKNTNDLSKFVFAKQVQNNKTTIDSMNGGDLENLKRYYFYVESISGEWKSNPSAIVSGITYPTELPLKPDHVSANAGYGSISLGWGNAEDAENYNVYYKLSTANEFIKANANPIEGNNFTINNLEANKAYTLYVEGVNRIGVGPRSIEVTSIPKQLVFEDPGMPSFNQISAANITVTLTNPGNLGGYYPNNSFNPRNVVDGDFSTHFTAGRWWESNAIDYTFSEATMMDHFAVTARMEPTFNKSIRSAQVSIWTASDDLNGNASYTKEIGLKHFSNEEGVRYSVAEFDKMEVKKIRIHFNIYNGAASNASISEIRFFEYYSLLDDVEGLFADSTFTTLNAGVNETQIDEILSKISDKDKYIIDADIIKGELELARSLLSGNVSKVKYLKENVKSKSGIQPLDVSAKAGSTVLVYANIPEGEGVNLVSMQYFAEASAYQGPTIKLVNGRNVIKVPRINSLAAEAGGPLYIYYGGTKPNEIKLHVNNYDGETGVNTKVFYPPTLDVLGLDLVADEATIKTKINTYIESLEEYVSSIGSAVKDDSIANHTEISINGALLSIPASNALFSLGNAINQEGMTEADVLFNNLLAWEEFLGLMYTLNGVPEADFDKQHQENIRYMRMFGKAFMYTNGSHIGIMRGSTGALVQGRPTSMTGAGNPNKWFGWGIAHEIGHNRDTIGYAEVSNNIYSLYAKVYDGVTNELADNIDYHDLYYKVSRGFPGKSNYPFVQLGLYWQLGLAYEDVQTTQEDYFYYQFNKLYKDKAVRSEITGHKDNRFAVVVSDVFGKNLTSFFESWGLVLSEKAKTAMASYPDPDIAIKYLSDESRRLKIAKTPKVTATNITEIDLRISKDGIGNGVLIDFESSENANLLGYEFKRNGKPIAFVQSASSQDETPNQVSFMDFLGNANNLAYSYSVVPIGKQGEMLAEVDLGQIKISYDVVINKNLYSTSLNDEGDTVISFTSHPETAAGIRFINYTNQEGTFDVVIKVLYDNNELKEFPLTLNYTNNQTTDENKYLTYFYKPGTIEDTRIWNYDIKEIVIKNAPVSPENIDLIQYPGDNVTFSDYAMGILEHDYVYDETAGEDGIIKAGTLIMSGTYVGDPVYNFVKLKGKYQDLDVSSGVTGDDVERDISGYGLMFAEVPTDGEASEISDGIWIFVPDIQAERELSESEKINGDHGNDYSVLPGQIKAEFYRTDDPNDPETKRLTSNTVWIITPSYESMPSIVIE